jgi:hypothetical protein
MVGIIFLILVLIALASIYSNLAMRIRLSKRVPQGNGFSWWMCSSGEVERTYAELFPGSYLPLIIRYTFWLVLGTAAAVLLVISLWKSN